MDEAPSGSGQSKGLDYTAPKIPSHLIYFMTDLKDFSNKIIIHILWYLNPSYIFSWYVYCSEYPSAPHLLILFVFLPKLELFAIKNCG